MRIAYALAAFVLLGAGGALGAWSDAQRETPRPPPGPASLLGGFSALAVQVLTIRADAAADRGDHAEALLQLDLIHELEPQLVRGADWIAHEIGVNMAGEEPDEGARFGLVVEGLRVHDRCIEANPGDPDALIQRGNYVLRRFAAQPGRTRRFARTFGRSPYEAALDDFRAALAIVPDDLETLDGIGVAALYAGRDHLIGGDRAASEERLAEAEAAFAESLARYQAEGLAVPSKEWALALTRALRGVLALPAGQQEAAYEDFFGIYGGPEGLPGLPEPPLR
jgi:tetratricopeptide (TPR) repeat protein